MYILLLINENPCFMIIVQVVAQYIGQHSGRGIKRTAKDVLNKAKEMQKTSLGGRQDGGR